MPSSSERDRGTAGSVPPWVARVLSLLGTILLGLAVWFVALSSAITAQKRVEVAGEGGLLGTLGQVWVGLAIACAFVIPFVIAMRRRSAYLTWGLGVVQGLLPLGPVMAFSLPAFLRRAHGAALAGAIALHAAGVLLFGAIDARGPSRETSVVRMFTAGTGLPHEAAPINLSGAVSLYVLAVVVPVAIGLTRRYRDQVQESRLHLAATQADLADRGASLGRMEDELTRLEEREMMAREIHDVIGHRLSMINVYAGGLELAAEEHPDLAERARLVREASQQTVDDLRSLVQVMRDPAARRVPGPESLADMVGMVEEVLGGGRPLSSSVMIDHAEAAPPVLVHAVYRILQELLTNAQKHAADMPVRVRVVGGPGRGLEIEVGNPVSHGPDGAWMAPEGGPVTGTHAPPSGGWAL
ncbi:MAG TPA: hypothetical protein GX743_01045, partial [Actinomycetales bacterium]|nr:hypothetical protein [Actinomycetales bacterium]